MSHGFILSLKKKKNHVENYFDSHFILGHLRHLLHDCPFLSIIYLCYCMIRKFITKLFIVWSLHVHEQFFFFFFVVLSCVLTFLGFTLSQLDYYNPERLKSIIVFFFSPFFRYYIRILEPNICHSLRYILVPIVRVWIESLHCICLFASQFKCTLVKFFLYANY